MRARPEPTTHGAAIRLFVFTALMTAALIYAGATMAQDGNSAAVAQENSEIVSETDAAESGVSRERMMRSAGEPRYRDQPRHGIAGRARHIRVNGNLLQQAEIELDLVDTPITIVRERIERKGERHLTWIGHVKGSSFSSEVVLTRVRGKISGHITLGRKLYEVTTTSSGEPIVFEVNTDGLPPDVEFHAPLTVPDQSSQRSSTPPVAADGPSIVDIMVLYTPRTCARYGRDSDGSCAATEAKVIAAVAAANQAYNNSAINVQLNLVHTDEVSYSESGDMGVTLSDLQRTNDGRLDQVHSLRNTHGADIVSLITEDRNACGVGYVMQNRSSRFASYAFNVVYSSCLSSQTLAHEVGHNMGSQHDRDSTSFPGVSSYAYGYRSCGSNGFTTVMAYGCSGAAGRSHFSNPSIRFSDGRPTGTSTENNARSINETATTVAAWRASTNGGGNTGTTGTGTGGGGTTEPPAEPVPTVPSTLIATALSTSSIEIKWTDRANNENGFHLDRARGTGSWARVATFGANATRVVNNGLAEGTNYRYRVRAFNGTGASAWSNTASATTSREVTSTESVPAAPLDFRYRYRANRNRVQLRWTDASDNETGFYVIRNNRVIATLGAGTRYYRDYSITQGQAYVYRVEAYNSAGGASTGTLRVDTRVGYSRINTSARVKTTSGGDTKIFLVWSGIPGNEVKVIRNNRVISTTNNDGRFINIRNKPGTWRYKVCDMGQDLCSSPTQIVTR